MVKNGQPIDLAIAPSARKSLDEKLTAEELEAFYDHSSDRAMAIMLGQMVENRLTRILRLLMLRDETLQSEMFRSSGPLGSFGTKIRLAYLLRTVDHDRFLDLMVVYKIRNDFAHDLSLKSFDNHSISSRIRNAPMFSIIQDMAGRAADEHDKSQSRETSAKKLITYSDANEPKRSFRAIVRYLLHNLADYEEAIHAAEAALNKRKLKPRSSPNKFR